MQYVVIIFFFLKKIIYCKTLCETGGLCSRWSFESNVVVHETLERAFASCLSEIHGVVPFQKLSARERRRV